MSKLPVTDLQNVYCAHVDRLHGPALIACVFEGKTPLEETQWHRHARGQFVYLESGTICVRTHGGVHAITPCCINWMPPGTEHTAHVIEPSVGWSIFVTPQAASGLPSTPSMLQGNALMRELVHRASGWANCEHLDEEQQRLVDVLMDEMRRARVPETPFAPPMPTDRRLLRIAWALLAHPGDLHNRDEWADWAGLSARSLTRRFRKETGLSFVQWRQQVRLGHALEQLGRGVAVARVAEALGYASVSAFVAMFRRALGRPPGRYLSLGVV